MKPLLTLSVICISLSFSGLSQQKADCTANVTALQEQIKELAVLLGDESIIEEVNTIQAEEPTDARLTLSAKDPNPYAVEQEITLEIPSAANDVEVIFKNSLGQEIKKVDVEERGQTSIVVYMSEYMIGNYSYSLVVDGNPV